MSLISVFFWFIYACLIDLFCTSLDTVLCYVHTNKITDKEMFETLDKVGVKFKIGAISRNIVENMTDTIWHAWIFVAVIRDIHFCCLETIHPLQYLYSNLFWLLKLTIASTIKCYSPSRPGLDRIPSWFYQILDEVNINQPRGNTSLTPLAFFTNYWH